MPLGLPISSAMGLYNTARCDAIEALLGNATTSRLFPACGDPVDGAVVVAVRASFDTKANAMAGLQLGFDVGVLLALFLNAFLAELWIRHRNLVGKMQTSVQDQAHQTCDSDLGC